MLLKLVGAQLGKFNQQKQKGNFQKGEVHPLNATKSGEPQVTAYSFVDEDEYTSLEEDEEV